MNILIELVKRDDGKMQLTHNGVVSLLAYHSCGNCKQMYEDMDGIGRCLCHGRVVDKWMVSNRSFGCVYHERKDDKVHKPIYVYKGVH